VLARAVGTPAYVYSATEIEARFRRLDALFQAQGLRPLIAYATKANDTSAVLALLGELGSGADVVSEGELRRAIAAGIPAERIVFSGVGKTEGEHRLALEIGVRQINVESREEFYQLVQVAGGLGRPAPVALRVNPDVGAGTLAQITTGTRDNKFGMPASEALDLGQRINHSPLLRFRGISVHIGSQITSLGPYAEALGRAGEVVAQLRELGVEVPAVDVGGGFGIPYRGGEGLDMAGYASLVGEFARRVQVEIVIEPGRWLVGPAGLLLTRVLHGKRQIEKRFVIVDAGMNDLIRPALYRAYHAVVPVRDIPGTRSLADVAGPVCETSDVVATDRCLPDALGPGDLVALLDAGAYGATMSSSYNTRRPPAAAMVRAGRWMLVRRRPSYDELLGLDADWLACRHLISLPHPAGTVVESDVAVSSIRTEENGK
jgi:diaminopimelate decarboxylase